MIFNGETNVKPGLLRGSRSIAILSWLAALDFQGWEKGVMSNKYPALPILFPSLLEGHPRLVCWKEDKYKQRGKDKYKQRGKDVR